MIFEMHSRSAAVLIALALFWSAFATYGQAHLSAPLIGVQVETNWLANALLQEQESSGAAEQRHPDDSSAQAQIEGSADSPELLQQFADPRVPALTMAPPRPREAAAWRAPTLDGLRRPPRAVSPTA